MNAYPTTHRTLRFLRLLIACMFILAPNAPTYAQQVTPKRIGVVLIGFTQESEEVKAFRQGLREANYVEGRGIEIEWRQAAGNPNRLPDLLADLVKRKVDVIVVESTIAAIVAKRATTTIPIVMAFVADPIASGIVKSLARPGGNITGLSTMTSDLMTKRLQLLKETVPHANGSACYGIPIPLGIMAFSRISGKLRHSSPLNWKPFQLVRPLT